MGRVKSLIATAFVMAMLWWVFELTDRYAWGAHQVVSGILEVAGFLFIGILVYLFMRFSDEDIKLLAKPRKRSWDEQWSGQWQR